MKTIKDEIIAFLTRKGRVHLSAIIGGLHWHNANELLKATQELVDVDDLLWAEYSAPRDENMTGHWYIRLVEDAPKPDKKIYNGFLYPTEGEPTLDVLNIMSKVNLMFNCPNTKDLRKLNVYLRNEVNTVTGTKNADFACDMAFDYRGRAYFTDWVNPALQEEVRKNFKFEDGSDIHWIDATASGIQMLSLLSRCQKSGKACNLVNTGKQEDPYAVVADHWGKEREEVKDPIMTSFYGSTKVPEITFGEDVDEFYGILKEAMPGAWQVNESFMAAHKQGNPYTIQWMWDLPDGFRVDASVFVNEYEEFRTEFCDQTVEMTVGFKRNKPNRHNKFLSANIAHSLDSFVLREVIRIASLTAGNIADLSFESVTREGSKANMGYLSMNYDFHNSYGKEDTDDLVELALIRETINNGEAFEIVPIHDCFGVRKENIEDVQRLYSYVLAKLVDSKYPKYLMKHFNVRWQMGKLTSDDLFQSRYALVEE